MENSNQPLFNSKPVLPNATTVLVLGICSIVFSCFFVGLVLGIIGIVLSNKGRALYKASPTMYEGYAQLNAGFIMSIIGTSLGALYIVYWIIWVPPLVPVLLLIVIGALHVLNKDLIKGQLPKFYSLFVLVMVLINYLIKLIL